MIEPVEVGAKRRPFLTSVFRSRRTNRSSWPSPKNKTGHLYQSFSLSIIPLRMAYTMSSDAECTSN